MALYVAANVAYLHVMTVPEMAATERVGAEVAARTMGPAGATVLTTVAAFDRRCDQWQYSDGRAHLLRQARDGLFFAAFGRVHPRFETPAVAIIAQAVWTGLLIVTGSFETLFAYAILSSWVFYTLGVAAVWVLRRKLPDAPRPYRMWGYPFTLWAFLIGSVWFMADAMVNQPKPSLIAFGIGAAGIPFYFFWRTRSDKAAVSASEPE